MGKLCVSKLCVGKLCVSVEHLNKCITSTVGFVFYLTLILQGAVTEFVGSLPTKTPAFSGDALGDVLMCTCAFSKSLHSTRLS